MGWRLGFGVLVGFWDRFGFILVLVSVCDWFGFSFGVGLELVWFFIYVWFRIWFCVWVWGLGLYLGFGDV